MLHLYNEHFRMCHDRHMAVMTNCTFASCRSSLLQRGHDVAVAMLNGLAHMQQGETVVYACVEEARTCSGKCANFTISELYQEHAI